MITESFFRRNLPHWQPPGARFFITYRLAWTLPRKVILDLKRERERLMTSPRELEYPESERNIRIDKKLFDIWDKYLDQDTNIQWLSNPNIAKIIRDNLYHHAGTKYSLWAYVIMPNHVHLVLEPDKEWIKRFENQNNEKAQYERGILSAILHSLRSYTANEANKVLSRTGKFWQNEAYDHWLRNNEEFQRVVYYVENNPVRAGLVKNPCDWLYSSAYDRIQESLEAFDRLA